MGPNAHSDPIPAHFFDLRRDPLARLPDGDLLDRRRAPSPIRLVVVAMVVLLLPFAHVLEAQKHTLDNDYTGLSGFR